MAKVALVVEFDVKPERREAFEELMRGHAQRCHAAEEGCLQFDVLIPQQDGNTVFLFECYRDDDALKTHRESPILAETSAAFKDMINDVRASVSSVA